MENRTTIDPLPIPAEALDDCGAILGRRGSGKSATKQLFFEYELDRGRRCCLIDPKGDSWGIRLNPDGSPSRFQNVPIFGGDHGDLPLSADMGAALGRMVATRLAMSCVVDLSALSVADMVRFMHDFAEALFDNNRAPITLYVDEADQLAPQNARSGMAKLLFQMERLVRMGRQRGIAMWMLTQRPQILNKNILSQAESLIAMKMTAPYDRRAIRGWLEGHDPVRAIETEENLSGLIVGEAYISVPKKDFFERLRFPLFTTYDSGRTPKHGEPLAEIELPPIDVSDMERELSAFLRDHGGTGDEGDSAKLRVMLQELAAMERRALAAEALLGGVAMEDGYLEPAEVVAMIESEREQRRSAEQEAMRLQAEIDKRRMAPTYFDAGTGIERRDEAALAYRHGRHALEKSNALSRQLDQAMTTIERQGRAIDTLAAEYEAAMLRAIRAEQALANASRETAG